VSRLVDLVRLLGRLLGSTADHIETGQVLLGFGVKDV